MERQEEMTKPARRSGWLTVIILVVWIAFIFGTSCTVIRPQEFFALVQKFANVDEASMLKFRQFWGVSWFVVVKGWHFSEFAILLVFCVKTIQFFRKSTSTSTIIAAMLFCIVFAISDEWHQSFIPDRYGTVMDVVIDSLGVLVAGIFLLRRHKRQCKVSENQILPEK